MPEIATAYVQIVPSAKGIKGSLENVLDSEAGDAGKKAGLNIAGTLGKALTGALAAAGVKEAIQKTLEVGGNLEQSFGGLETIYGTAAEKAKDFAREASAAGISANTYAEQAVSFGAALKQSFGDDLEGAVDAANTAIMDMADNAAKMGTPIENIQTAYQGFAKQNYTMLDNLKLGYGGTKTEMERLLKDAQKISGVKYDISSLGDVYDAIHVIQGELGLTGVAAAEAEETLLGSMNAVKASLENVMGAIATGDGIEAPLAQLMTSVGNFLFKNLFPMLLRIVTAIPGVLKTLFATVAPLIGETFTSTMSKLPELIESGTEMVNKVISGIISGIPQFISMAGELITNFVMSILSNIPAVLGAGMSILSNLVNGLLQNRDSILQAAANAIANFVQGILTNLPTILQKGIEIIAQLVAGIISAIPKIILAIPQVIKAIVNAFSGFNWAGIGADILRGIANGIRNGAGILIDAAKNAAKAAFEAAKDFLKIGSPSKLFEVGVGKWIPAGMARGIVNNFGLIKNAMSRMAGMTVTDFASDLSSGQYSVSADSGTNAGGFNQVLNIYSPRELTPSEIARQTRNATQQMALELRGV